MKINKLRLFAAVCAFCLIVVCIFFALLKACKLDEERYTNLTAETLALDYGINRFEDIYKNLPAEPYSVVHTLKQLNADPVLLRYRLNVEKQSHESLKKDLFDAVKTVIEAKVLLNGEKFTGDYTTNAIRAQQLMRKPNDRQSDDIESEFHDFVMDYQMDYDSAKEKVIKKLSID